MPALLNSPPAIDDELAVLLRWLEYGAGTFSSGLATCNAPALRESLIVQIRESHPEVTVVEIPAKTVDVYGYVMDHYPSAKALFLIGLEASILSPEAYSHTLKSLNASRDLWPVRYPCPILLWLPEYAVTALQRQARDYWRFISHRFFFAKELADKALQSIEIYGGKYLDAINLSNDEKLERIHELKSRLASVDIAAIPVMQQHALRWWGELATLYRFTGNPDEALRIHREEELSVYERLGDVREKAVTMGQIADILQQRGQVDEALRICREECIPVFERLGEVRSKAVIMGKIADILQQRGEIDEALRIHREECIPVYERLGDVREKAVTMGRIADILKQSGQTAEALRIRREEELPVYERLGDVRSKSVTMGKIADILQQRGETHETIRTYREILPILERLGDLHSQVACRYRLGNALLSRGYKKDIPIAQEHLRWALATAETHQYAEAAQLRAEVTQLLGARV